jgi:hypothetical protein
VSDEIGTTSIPGDIQSLEVQGTLNDKKKHNLGFYSVWKMTLLLAQLEYLRFAKAGRRPIEQHPTLT